jgi:hypothetical protein
MATTFVGLYDKDAVKTTGTIANSVNAWKWTLPTNINARQAPTARLSIASAFLDDSYATPTGNQNCSAPRMLRMKIYSENFLQNETSSPYIAYPIMGMMVRDAFVGHWYLPQAPHQIDLDFSTNIRTIEFDFIACEDGSVLDTKVLLSQAGNLNIVLKLEYPEHNVLRDEIVMSYAQSQVGSPPFNRL